MNRTPKLGCKFLLMSTYGQQLQKKEYLEVALLLLLNTFCVHRFSLDISLKKKSYDSEFVFKYRLLQAFV